MPKPAVSPYNGRLLFRQTYLANYEGALMGHPLLDLDGKTAVVIGGTSGIGFALTGALAQAGANVVPTGRRTELIRKAADQVTALGRRSLVQSSDVTDAASLDSLLKATIKE